MLFSPRGTAYGFISREPGQRQQLAVMPDLEGVRRFAGDDSSLYFLNARDRDSEGFFQRVSNVQDAPNVQRRGHPRAGAHATAVDNLVGKASGALAASDILMLP